MLMHPKFSPALFAAAVLVLTGAVRAAEPSDATTPPHTHATETIEACMAKWDPGTHMTKEQWRETCQRIKDEREPYVRGSKQ
jgi:hypothetical protein